jgi:hypothetical protein
MAGVQMYDPETGRTFDGINGPVSWRLNRNSGAESTIEGLMSMSALARIPAAHPFLYVESAERNLPLIFEAENGQRVVGTPVYYAGTWTGEGYISAGRYVGLGEGQRMRLIFDLEQADDYLLYVAHVRQAQSGSAFLIPRVATVPVIDGNGDDWSDTALLLESNTARQFLRGAGLWDGPEVDSHAVALQWDDDYLYLLANVRDPEHDQPFNLSTVWQGDTLWLYFTASPEARALSAKLTLAHTPQGDELWDWLKTEFARGATLAWSAAEDSAGYTYEAAIPWETLGVSGPQPGHRIGLEIGRGIGGNSFMNLTGRDPDIAANLLQLTLTAPGMDSALGESPEVALEVRLDREDAVVIPQSVSPDSDFFWLDLVTPQPVTLAAGEHTIRYEYAGGTGTSNPGISKIDAFYLQPVVGRNVLRLMNGGTVILTYNTLNGDSNIEVTLPEETD